MKSVFKDGEIDELFDLEKNLKQLDYIFERVGLA
jgi:hypothetical protein